MTNSIASPPGPASPGNPSPTGAGPSTSDILIGWTEEEKLSRIVDHAELKKIGYNISPSRYIHTSDAETYRPIAEIVAELDAIEADNDDLKEIEALEKDLKRKGGKP